MHDNPSVLADVEHELKRLDQIIAEAPAAGAADAVALIEAELLPARELLAEYPALAAVYKSACDARAAAQSNTKNAYADFQAGKIRLSDLNDVRAEECRHDEHVTRARAACLSLLGRVKARVKGVSACVDAAAKAIDGIVGSCLSGLDQECYARDRAAVRGSERFEPIFAARALREYPRLRVDYRFGAKSVQDFKACIETRQRQQPATAPTSTPKPPKPLDVEKPKPDMYIRPRRI